MRQYFTGLVTDSTILSIATTPTTTSTALFSPGQSELYFPLPFGLYGPSVPFAGQVFRFAFGGIITTPATGTLIITPYHGGGASTTVFGTSLGASAASTVTASLASQPFRVEGEIVYRLISPAATSSTAWLTGTFWSQGTIASANNGWVIPFGSTAAVSVDTTGIGGLAASWGCLNFGVVFSVTGATVTVAWTSMQALN